jgi:hypothetical protein
MTDCEHQKRWKQTKNDLGTAAFVLGIITMPGALLLPRLLYIVAILAIIFGGIGPSRVKKGTADNGTASGWGLGLGIAGYRERCVAHRSGRIHYSFHVRLHCVDGCARRA